MGTALRERRVTKSNELVEASYRLTLGEQRVLLAAIAQIDSRKPRQIAEKSNHTIDAVDFAETYGIPLRHAYESLKDASDRLFERELRTYDKNNQVRRKARWVESVTYHGGQGQITLQFTERVKPLLYELTKRFTTYDLAQVAHLRSVYAIRLYELLKQYAGLGTRTFAVDKIRDRLGLGDQYKRFNNFRMRVIDPAVKEINDTTDLEVSFTTKRRHKQIASLVFSISERPQRALALEGEEKRI